MLVVDENRDGALRLAAMLTTLGYETRLVYDGGTALEEAVQFWPHVALVDMGLPAMDGFALARALTSRPGLESLRLIAVTGDGPDRDLGASGQAGFAAHLVKPVAVEQLYTALAAAGAAPKVD